MEEDFFGDTISVELAIQRELEYRSKLALQLNPNDDIFKDLIPLQLQSSTPRPISNQPSPSAGSKRKEPPNVDQPQVLLMKPQSSPRDHILETNTSTNYHDLRCKLCNVECSSHLNLRQHLAGQKHRAKLAEPIGEQRRWCHVCAIPCTNEDGFKMHLQGRKHKAKVLELESISLTGPTSAEPGPVRGVYCETCRVWCANQGCLKQHLEGRKHKLQLYDLHKN